MRKILILSSILIVAGCAQNPPYPVRGYGVTSTGNPAPAAAPIKAEQPKINDDPFSNKITIAGTQIEHSSDLGLPSEYFFPQIWTEVDRKTGDVKHQIRVGVAYTSTGPNWVDWNSANNQNAEPMEVVKLDRSGDNCVRVCVRGEKIAFPVSHAELVGNKASGYAFKIYNGKGREQVLRLTPDQISKQLAVLDSDLFGGKNPSLSSAIPETSRPAPLEPRYTGEGWVNPKNGGSVAYPAPVRTY